MNRNRIKWWPRAALAACGLFALAATGCQTTIGGQTLPSGYYLQDDVQYFPAGPETPLPNARRIQEQYRLEQQAIDEGLNEQAP